MNRERELLQNMQAMLTRACGYSNALQAHSSKFTGLMHETNRLSTVVTTLLREQEQTGSAGAPASEYKPLIVNGNLKALPDITQAASYPFNITLSMNGEKYFILLADFGELAEAVNVLLPMIEAGAASLIGINQLFIQPGTRELAGIGSAKGNALCTAQDCKSIGNYTCLTCGTDLCYAHAISYNNFFYCAQHAPAYDKHAQW